MQCNVSSHMHLGNPQATETQQGVKNAYALFWQNRRKNEAGCRLWLKTDTAAVSWLKDTRRSHGHNLSRVGDENVTWNLHDSVSVGIPACPCSCATHLYCLFCFPLKKGKFALWEKWNDFKAALFLEIWTATNNQAKWGRLKKPPGVCAGTYGGWGRDFSCHPESLSQMRMISRAIF